MAGGMMHAAAPLAAVAPVDQDGPSAVAMAEMVIEGVCCELGLAGLGRPLLLADFNEDAISSRAWITALAGDRRVIAPRLAGYRAEPGLAPLRSVGDIAYFAFDLMDALDLWDATLVGAGLGAFVAAEMAIRSTERLSALVLIDPIGLCVRQWLHRIRVPVLVLCGECADEHAIDVGQAFAAELPASRFALVPGAGSAAHLTHPAQVVSIMEHFLRTSEATAAWR
jgi:pimeloyl-ACP methyl ester carboxylesterase